ncbi:adenine nucleotide alpha hydrolase family protein [Alkalihalobacterium elongatum]|uniref:hypothetical protein n=1 Tax=Alkalihalobacterium elongatum TaxID=2675466 RepID=UPI001C1F7C03|nr:hypothetical protein [Alkalihalobacterium elongatum]
MLLHQRQFIIGPKPYLLNKNWSYKKITSKYYLSHCKDLPVLLTKDANECSWFLIGLAYQSVAERADPKSEIQFSQTKNVSKAYTSWSGRWVLVGNDSLHMDACGLLGCYYQIINKGKAKELIISSSAALINEVSNPSPIIESSSYIEHARGMDWFPPPQSKFRNINRLLPSQILNFSNNKELITPRSLLFPISPNLKYEEKIFILKECLSTILRNIAKVNEPIWIALSGGYDSRLLLSALHYTGLEAKSYTYDKPSISKADLKYPPLLSKLVGIEHQLIKRKNFSNEISNLFDSHTAKHCVDIDRSYFAHGQWGSLPKPAFILRGGVNSVGKCNYYRKFPEKLPNSPQEITQLILNVFKFNQNSQAHQKGIFEFASWMLANPQNQLDWRERLFIEQRIAGWLSSIEQGIDLAGYNSLHITNCTYYLSVLLSISDQKRKAKKHIVDLMQLMSPSLLKYPFNRV